MNRLFINGFIFILGGQSDSDQKKTYKHDIKLQHPSYLNGEILNFTYQNNHL